MHGVEQEHVLASVIPVPAVTGGRAIIAELERAALPVIPVHYCVALLRQFLCFCTSNSKASKLSTCGG
jgi:hypothetical protein